MVRKKSRYIYKPSDMLTNLICHKDTTGCRDMPCCIMPRAEVGLKTAVTKGFRGVLPALLGGKLGPLSLYRSLLASVWVSNAQFVELLQAVPLAVNKLGVILLSLSLPKNSYSFVSSKTFPTTSGFSCLGFSLFHLLGFSAHKESASIF